MINFNDIYYVVDSSLIKNDFWNVPLDEKKKLIDIELKNYMILKLKELGKYDDFNAMKTIELFKLLASLIPENEHENTIRHFIHYVLNILGNFQNYTIIWFVENADELIYEPEMKKENGIYVELKTHMKTDYVKTFNFVYNVFKDETLNSSNKLNINLKNNI